ncbi:MAG: pyruvate oxidase [Lactococcus raffinolactis]|nr:pyruvate oxidase [Lactococcus raffinolactis]MDN6029432.1 pyruvate oxidase [Lactococcus plantarum]MDN5494643.1 pyruvate oxidase [Lactococcus raffinolactis]MDN5580006.1 pyruvate oxidase [Lactococcus raffinolactis]MDN6044913.1 pyruvate oxidase [Lactococcus raffinolactis]
MEKINAGVAAVKVLEEWGVKHIYGIPGGSINSLMDALLHEKDVINYIQVRHEEVGALAASMHAKYTGHIGVAFGSAGPGGTHLLNGLYDAREDHVPVLAIVGQFATNGMNMDTFQEMNENPIYADVAVYNRTITTAEQIPHVIDEAIRQAYAKSGVAVVQLPVNLGTFDIPAKPFYSAANAYRKFPKPTLHYGDIEAAVKILDESEKTVIYAGIGTRGAGQDVVDLSRKIKAPVAVTGINFDAFDANFEALLGSANRVATKPANEAFPNADTVVFVGNNYPFAEVTNLFENVKNFIQIDINPANLGKRNHNDVTILGDAGDAIRELTKLVKEKPETGWWRANLANIKNWNDYVYKLETKTEGDLQLYQVYHQINTHAEDDAIFSIDVGDVTQTSVRHLHLNPKQMWRTSNLFATMGIGIPGALTAKLDFPDRQVWNLAGDGGFNMVMQDLATEVQYKLPIINIVFSNNQFGFIKDEQEETNSGYIGVEFMGVDFAKIAQGMGAKGYTLTSIDDAKSVFDAALADIAKGETVLIDAKISGDRPIPVEALILDKKIHDQAAITAYRERYEAESLVPLTDYLKAEGIEPEYKEVDLGGF